MLKKLLKYDLNYKFKVLSVFYAIAIFFAVLTRLFFAVENSFIIEVIAKICSGVTISMIFNIIINAMMRCWVGFKRNLYGDESYLSHTLPVTKTQHYLSKAFSSVITLSISVAVIVATLFIAYYSKANWEILKNVLSAIGAAFDESIALVIVASVGIIFLELANGIQCGFTGIILGHRMNSNKTAFSVLYGFVTYMLSQIIALSAVFAVGIFDKDVMNLFFTAEIVSVGMIKTLFVLAIITYTIIVVIGAFVNVKLFKKGVNVD